MPIQPEPILRGAVRWLERIPESGIARARSLLVTNPRLADLTPTQYETALQWLEKSGLLAEQELGIAAAIRVYKKAVTEAGWFADTDSHVRSPDQMPQDALNAADALAISELDAFQHLIAVWSKVDTAVREQVGRAGEERLVALLEESVVADVDHVSQWSDGHGYDIAVTAPEFASHLEVKSSTRRGRLAIYLSRNEFDVMRSDPHWTLVAVTLSADLNLASIQTVRSSWLLNAAPLDMGLGGRWQSCRFDIPSEATQPGLSAVNPILRANASSLLRGARSDTARDSGATSRGELQ